MCTEVNVDVVVTQRKRIISNCRNELIFDHC